MHGTLQEKVDSNVTGIAEYKSNTKQMACKTTNLGVDP